MGADAPMKAKLLQATDTLGGELFFTKSSLDTYRIIGLNASRLEFGKLIFGHVQQLSLRNIALGLAKVFEREEEGGFELCSVSGVLRLAKGIPIEEISAAHAFAADYGVTPQDDWIAEIDEVFARERPVIARHMPRVTRARNTRIAHLQQGPTSPDLPSIAAFEELLAFATKFHAFVNRAFLRTNAHPILTDTYVANDLGKVLELVGVDDVATTFPEQPHRRGA